MLVDFIKKDENCALRSLTNGTLRLLKKYSKTPKRRSVEKY